MTSTLLSLVVGLSAIGSIAQANPTRIVPKTDFSYWLEDSNRTYSNNCYNYGTNHANGTYAQPGAAAGAQYTDFNCANVYEAASKDVGLIPTQFFPFSVKDDDTLIALVVAPGYDFHWYRRDDNNMWTHKMGWTDPTDLDNSGNKIADVEAADRGAYTEFCGYFRIVNTPSEAHEQNGGQVVIGDRASQSPLMSKAPRKSFVSMQIFAGRENPEVSLKQLMENNEGRRAFKRLAAGAKNARKTVNTKPLQLKAQSVVIVDHDGLVFPKGTLVRIQDSVAAIRVPKQREYLVTLPEAKSVQDYVQKALEN